MIRSMTGFGSASTEADGQALTVEVRSVNHRFCDVKARLPRELAPLEPRVGAGVRRRLERGAVEVSVRRTGEGAASPGVRLDLTLARRYGERLAELGESLQLAGTTPATVLEVAQLPGVLALEEPVVDLAASEALLGRSLDAALDQLIAMREREGETLAVDLRGRLATVRSLVAGIRARLPEVLKAWQERIQTRVAALAGEVEVDPQRLAAEVAILVERSDVAEELTRLDSHIEQFERLLAEEGPVGRKLDFLVQELNREANTLGSKVQSAELSQRVVDIKGELERVREQVQNVE